MATPLRALPARILRRAATSTRSSSSSSSSLIKCAARPTLITPTRYTTTPTSSIQCQSRFYSAPPAHEPNPALSQRDYNLRSDETMEALLAKLEELMEENPDADVEYSSGVLTLVWPQNGTYVINKQPPNKQIWLSSPVSGPKRYDYDIETKKWVYLRDGSTLDGLLREEVGVEFDEGDL